MFSSGLIRLVLALALGVLPLQGLAETVHGLLCQMHGHGGVTHASPDGHGSHVQHAHRQSGAGHAHEAHGSDHSIAHGAPGSDGADASDEGATEGHAGHFCCDVVVAALPTAAMTVTQSEFPSLRPAREGFHGSAFLEFPQRPPLI